MLDGLEARPLAPFDLGFINRQLQFRPAPEQSLQRAYALKARQLMAEAKMNPSTESEMAVRLSREIELFRMWICLRIEVGSRQHGHDLVALSQPDTAEFDVFANKSRLGELHHRNEPQEFFHGQASPAPVFFQPIAQPGIWQELIDRATDQMSSSFVPGEQQQKHHGHHLVAADLPAFLFNAHQLGNKTCGSPRR